MGCRRSLAALLALAALALLTAPAGAARLRGVVVDGQGKPVEFATVSVPAAKRGAATDADGRFELDLPDGPAVIEVQQLGFERRRIEVRVADGLAPLRVVLIEQPVELAEVSVSASSFGKVGKSEGATLRRMQILITPGGAADVFQTLRAMPGLTAPSDGAALYVRGGTPSETMVRLDGAELGHPYHYEGAAGGLFSAIDTYMLKSAFFSSGGFSAKYGGVLSGVLEVETADPMNLKTVSVGANIVGGGGSTTWSLIPDRLSFLGSYRMSNTGLLTRMYGTTRDYEQVPASDDAAGRLLWRYRPTGKLSATYLDARDRTALTTDYLSFRTKYSERARTRFGSLQLQDALGKSLAVHALVSGQFHRNDWRIGPFGGSDVDRTAQANVEGVWAAGPRHEVSFGANLRRRGSERTSIAPADSTDFSPDAPTRAIATRPEIEYPGGYLEDKLRVWGPIYATLGARVDWASEPGVTTVDPRASLAWRVDERQTLRLSVGRYHQLAESRYLDPVFGNADLGPLRSDHVIAGYEWKSEHSNVRLEAYKKTYRDLVTNDARTFYANGGHGFARGVDAFVQGEHRWLTGWVSYSYLDARRKEFSNPRQVPATFGLRHALSVVGLYQVSSSFQVGGKWSYSSGRPYTPVVSASYDAAAGIWRPTFAEDNSGKLPDYRRLDLRLLQLFSLPKGLGLPASGISVVYLEAMNVLDIRNVLDYTYSADYSQRFEQASYFGRRLLVFGFGLTW